MKMIVVVTQCFPPAIGGIENLMGGAAKALHARGHDVVVLADGHKGRVDDSGRFGSVRYFDGWKPLRRWRKARALRHLLSEGSVQAVLADSWKSVETLVRSGVPTGDAVIVCFAHGNEYSPTPKGSKARRITDALVRVGKVVAVSQFTADRVKRYHDSQTIVVRSPPVEELVPSSPEDRAWAEGLWAGGRPRLLSLARLEPLKGVDHTILALNHLVERHPDIRYVVAGPGDDLPRLQSLAAENGFRDRVVFAGPVTGGRKTALYESADLFVMPTRRVGDREEGFGMVYLEAAQCGLPIVGGLSGGARDVLRHEDAGILVDGQDIAAVAAAIASVVDDDKRRLTMSQAARKAAADTDWSTQIAALERDLGVSAD
jgi:phosphatidylinositol alpha-1,6-mannosyltransferase